jgi:hypothetical protein
MWHCGKYTGSEKRMGDFSKWGVKGGREFGAILPEKHFRKSFITQKLKRKSSIKVFRLGR